MKTKIIRPLCGIPDSFLETVLRATNRKPQGYVALNQFCK